MIFEDYIWKNGIPLGINKKELLGSSYKIVADPYRKRISIEKYQGTEFKELVYDSALLDFRHLKLGEQNAWQKVMIENDQALIRNQDDRLVYREEYTYENGLCRTCSIFCPYGTLLSTHRLFYTSLNDPFNGVILYDREQRIVVKKVYAIDESTQEFTTLLTEDWEIPHELRFGP